MVMVTCIGIVNKTKTNTETILFGKSQKVQCFRMLCRISGSQLRL